MTWSFAVEHFTQVAGAMSGVLGRIASPKSSFVRFKHLFSSDPILVSPPRPHLHSSALEQERNMAYVREKEEDSS